MRRRPERAGGGYQPNPVSRGPDPCRQGRHPARGHRRRRRGAAGGRGGRPRHLGWRHAPVLPGAAADGDLRHRRPRDAAGATQHRAANLRGAGRPLRAGLPLPAEVADAWKQRLRTVTRTVRTPDGRHAQVQAARINYRECLTPVRAFYLDLAQWAVEDPARWAPWVAPCPVGAEEINRRKHKRHRKARMDARTRERLPVLPVLVATVDQRRTAAAALLAAARQSPPGHAFTAAGQTLGRARTHRSAVTKVWAEDPATGNRRDLGREEDHAFWAWAAVEVLRATGIRVEELTELSHHSLVQYRLPTTGELVPLLQIAPSKTDVERLLLVSPELADVLSAIICRTRDT